MNTTLEQLTDLAEALAEVSAHVNLSLANGTWRVWMFTRPITHEYIKLRGWTAGVPRYGLIDAESLDRQEAINLAAARARIVIRDIEQGRDAA